MIVLNGSVEASAYGPFRRAIHDAADQSEIADGSPDKIPRMGTLLGLGTPSSCRLSVMAIGSATLQGAGTGEPPELLRWNGSFHQFRGPFLEQGVFG